MNTQIKAAVIIAAAILAATLLYLYFSPFQACMRETGSATTCARFLGGR